MEAFRRVSFLTVVTATVTLMLMLTACTQPNSPTAAQAVSNKSGKPFSSPTPAGPPYEYDKATNLVGASTEQIAIFAQQYAKAGATVDRSEPQVLLSRFVRKEELNSLGLPCINFDTIEEPPLAVVVLRGNFGYGKLRPDGVMDLTSYKVQVLDLWAAEATYSAGSYHGGMLRQLLNDPTLPEDFVGQNAMLSSQQLTPCQESNETKTLHYGDTLPGVVIPTVPSKPFPSETAPPPWPTNVPLPVAKPTGDNQ